MPKKCESTLDAPFVDGKDAQHQCSREKGHFPNHYCGCPYEWDRNGHIVVFPYWAEAELR